MNENNEKHKMTFKIGNDKDCVKKELVTTIDEKNHTLNSVLHCFNKTTEEIFLISFDPIELKDLLRGINYTLEYSK